MNDFSPNSLNDFVVNILKLDVGGDPGDVDGKVVNERWAGPRAGSLVDIGGKEGGILVNCR